MKQQKFWTALEILTIGLPFCAFKIIFGFFLMQWPSFYYLAPLFIVWGVLDVILNLTNLLSLIARPDPWARTCTLNYIVRPILRRTSYRHLGKKDLGTALDVAFSFSIVAFMVGGSFLGKLPHLQSVIWNWSVVLNVLSAGLNRIAESLKRLEKKVD